MVKDARGRMRSILPTLIVALAFSAGAQEPAGTQGALREGEWMLRTGNALGALDQLAGVRDQV